jgi:hypothetical protein
MSPPKPSLNAMKQAFSFTLLLLLSVFLNLRSAEAAVAISQAQVGNVDAGQFYVFWQVDGETIPALDIYSDSAGTTLINGQLGVEFFPLDANDISVTPSVAQREARRTLQELTRSKNTLLAKVTGARAGTTYHVRPRSFAMDGVTANETTLAALLEVKTPDSTAFVIESRQLRVSVGGCYTGSQGQVMKLSHANSRYPLFSVIGDYEQEDQAVFDVSRLLNTPGATNLTFSGNTRFNLELYGASGSVGSSHGDVTFTATHTVAQLTDVIFAGGFPGLAYFSLDPVGAPRIGRPFNFSVTARTESGQVLTAYNGTVEISAGSPEDLLSGAGTSPAFVNGVLASYQVVPAALGSLTLTATRPCGIETGSRTFNVVPASVGIDITFSAIRYTAGQDANSVVLTLNREETQPASIILNTQDGIAQTSNPPFAAAVAGTDYVDLAGAQTVVEFAENEVTKQVTVSVVPKAGSKVPNRRFSASLSPSVAGAELAGAILKADIYLLATDTKVPTLKVVTPAASKPVSAALPYAVTGIAGDIFGIDRVEIILNGGAPILATLGENAKPTAVPFSAGIAPIVGSNTITVTAYDLSGNASTTITRTFNFTRRYRLTLARIVPEAVSATPDKAGTLTLAALPKTAAGALTKGPAPQRSEIVGGTEVKITATAKTGHLFSHWEGLPEDAALLGNVANFTMPEEDLADAKAIFIANPLPGLFGNKNIVFQGLLLPDAETERSNSTVGLLASTVVTAKGSLSGKLTMDGLIIPFTAVLNGNGSVWFKTRNGVASILNVNDKDLSLEWAASGLTARVEIGEDSLSEGLARPASYSATSPVSTASGLLNRGKDGYATLSLPATVQSPVKDLYTYPQGTGYATLTLGKTGTLKVVGQLADGSKITASSILVGEVNSPVFIQLPTPGGSTKDKKGSFLGSLVFDPTATNTDVTSDMQWYRPKVTEDAKKVITHLYTNGWESGIRIAAIGTFYDGTKDVQTSLALSAPDTAAGNGRLLFEEGRLASDVEVTNFNIAASKVTKIPANDKTFTLTLTSKTGLFKGTFTPNWTESNAKLPLFQGVILQKGTNASGDGYFISNRTGDTDPESGRATLTKPE